MNRTARLPVTEGDRDLDGSDLEQLFSRNISGTSGSVLDDDLDHEEEELNGDRYYIGGRRLIRPTRIRDSVTAGGSSLGGNSFYSRRNLVLRTHSKGTGSMDQDSNIDNEELGTRKSFNADDVMDRSESSASIISDNKKNNRFSLQVT